MSIQSPTKEPRFIYIHTYVYMCTYIYLYSYCRIEVCSIDYAEPYKRAKIRALLQNHAVIPTTQHKRHLRLFPRKPTIFLQCCCNISAKVCYSYAVLLQEHTILQRVLGERALRFCPQNSPIVKQYFRKRARSCRKSMPLSKWL